MLGCINTETGYWSHNQYLIRDFIIGIHKAENVDKQKTLLRKEKYPEYVEIWGDEDELKLISIIRNIEKDSHKLTIRALLRHIYDKTLITYITKNKVSIYKNELGIQLMKGSTFEKVSQDNKSKGKGS